MYGLKYGLVHFFGEIPNFTISLTFKRQYLTDILKNHKVYFNGLAYP